MRPNRHLPLVRRARGPRLAPLGITAGLLAAVLSLSATNSVTTPPLTAAASLAVTADTPSTGLVVVDVSTTQTFTGNSTATAWRWLLDGEEVSTSATFAYTPPRHALGTHWLRVVETSADASTLTRQWAVRVRLPAHTSARTFHVSPSGSDATGVAGTAVAPFASLERARDAIRALTAEQRAGGVTVYLHGGVHRRSTTFVLSAQDSGTESAPIVYAALPGATPILTSTREIPAAQWSPLATSEHARIAPGVDVSRIWETSVAGNARAAAFPAVFNEWVIFNALRSTFNGGLLEVFANGERQRLSRYPNVDLVDDTATPTLAMNGVATGTASDGTGYLNGAGTYTLGDGSTATVGGAFHYADVDAERVARWQTALTRGGLWLAGYWRVPWQLNGIRVSLIDPVKKVIGFVPNATNAANPIVSNGIGDKYTRPAGSKKEPWWVVNLLEELDQPGEWCIDFSRQRLYFLMPRAGAPADGEIELSDVGTPLIQLNGASDVRLSGLTFRRHLGINVQILTGARNLVVGCTFLQAGNLAVDIRDGTGHGVLSSDFEKLGAGGVMLRGGATTPELTPANHFAINNRFRSFGEVVRVYQAAIDIGYGGPLGNWGLPTVGMRAAHNDIRTSPHAGILWNGHRHVIEYNEISDFTRISNDLGAIYRFGPNADFRTVIRYNHLFDSPLGEGVYNDFDHVRTPVYGNTINLKTPTTASRGYGVWTNTNTATGGAVAGLSTALQVYNNISVNARSGYSLHSATGGRIENNISYRPRVAGFLWYRISTNATTLTQSVATSNATTLQSGPNLAYATDPGFVDYANDDLRLRPDAAVYRDLPNFEPIPLELAGLRADEVRTASATRGWKPFITTNAARDVGANTATFTATLTYPQFDANATVRVYWGASDGGDTPAAWAHVATLGPLAAGAVSYTPTNLAPATRYYFRFHAENTAGAHWAELTNTTTTFALLPAPTDGTASATSVDATTPAALAFDANTATAWRSAAGAPTATLTYTFAGTTTARVTRYTLTSAADFPARDPRDWRVEGSTDGLAWTTLDARTSQAFTGRGQTLAFGFSNATAFRHYRLVITANAGDASQVQLADWALFVPGVTADTNGTVITTPGNLSVVGTNSAGAAVTFDVSALDALSGLTPAVATPASGSFFPVGTTLVTVTATDTAGNTSTATFTITVTAPTLPAPWTLRQISPYAGAAAGSVTVLGPDSFQLHGAGGATTGGTTADMWTGNNDSFTYFSQPWSGDGVFTARLATFTSADTSAKTGISFRETTATGSRYSAIYLMRTNSGAVWAQHKTAPSGSTTNVNFFTSSITSRGIPEWIRLVRRGDTFTTFYSADGTTWFQLGTARANPLAGAALSVGLFVAPRTGNSSAVATIDHVSFHTPREDWRVNHFGAAATSPLADDLADPDGDGSPNLLEYALGSTPTSAASLPITPLTLSENFLQITFTRLQPDLDYAVEASSDLVSWTDVPFAPPTVGETITVSDTVSLAEATRRFLRLRVSTQF